MRSWIDRTFRAGFLRATFRVAAIALVVGMVAFVGVLIAALSTALPTRLADRHSTVVDYRNDIPAHVFLSEDDRWRVGVTLDDVDPDYVEALLRFEDKRFYDHPGFDPIAIARAAWLNVTFGRRMSGASTITMQLVRVLEPRPRTYASKLVEAFRAFQLELHYTKEEILAAYLTFAPYGRNIEGIEAASLAYFGHRADELTPAEIATLLAVPQNPNRRYPTPENVSRLRDARNEIAAWLLDESAMPLGEEDGRVAPEELRAQIEAMPVPQTLQPFPRDIPHVAYWLRANHPGEQRFRTTLDPGVQLVAERIVSNHHGPAQRAHIDDASVVVLDEQHRVVALVGNFDFWADRKGAQIPAFDVPRSPGSLLKPFLYALAIDRGIAHPSHLVLDTPMRAGSYTPGNYDGTFRGLVRLDEALSRSLNVPFVRLLNEIGVDQFIGTLRMMGAEHLVGAPGYYGLSAAIGGVELTPLEVAGMYAALGHDGDFRDVRLLRGGWDRIPIVSPGAAWLTRRTLRKRDRPGFNRRRANPGAPRIWWKTGTSYGHRDAWAAGGGQHFTAVAWLGNLDHRPSAALVGADRAGPLLFDVLEAIEYDDDGVRDRRPDDLAQVEVCSYSGRLPDAACDHTEKVWAPRSRVPTERCPYHVRVAVDDETGEALAPACRAGREYTEQSFVVWPATVRRFMTDRRRAGPRVPTLAEGCGQFAASRPPKIVSPPHDQTLVLMPGVDPSEQEIPLEAESELAGAKLDWFVNGEFLGSADADGRLWWTPRPGTHELVVTNGAGHAARRLVKVRSNSN